MKVNWYGLAIETIQTLHLPQVISIKLFPYYKIWKEKYILVHLQELLINLFNETVSVLL